jgi:1,4-alpha-glucan branching enzyme
MGQVIPFPDQTVDDQYFGLDEDYVPMSIEMEGKCTDGVHFSVWIPNDQLAAIVSKGSLEDSHSELLFAAIKEAVKHSWEE